MRAVVAMGVIGALALAGPASVAHAHGTFPATASVAFLPGDAQRIYLVTTFGLLISDDDGATWRWTCEANMGVDVMGALPVVAVSAPGTIFATTTRGLSISHDDACSWSYADGALAGLRTDDVQVASDGAVWTVTTSGAQPNDVFVSRDDGVDFAATGPGVEGAAWKSVRVAPGDPARVYVSGELLPAGGGVDGGLTTPTPLLYRSDDGGQGWTALPFAFQGEPLLFVLGVSPADPDVVFARVAGAAADTLLRSTDGAHTWQPVLTFTGDGADLVAFVIRDPDGQEILAGTKSFGTRISHDGGGTWAAPAQALAASCFGERPADRALFGCGENWNPDHIALGRSVDGGETWSKLFRFVELDDELDCPADSGHVNLCAGQWQALACMFGIGKFDAGVVAVTPDAAPPIDGPPPTTPGGCGCGVGLAGVGLVWPWRRRRRPGR